jgi:hypothetical protein
MIYNFFSFVKVPTHINLMPVLADDAMLILLKCRDAPSGTLKFDKEHTTFGGEKDAIRDTSAAR